MDNKKLLRVPAVLLTLLLATALTLGLAITGCSDDNDGDNDVVKEVNIKVPINVDSLESLMHSAAPAQVKRFQVCGFDKDGNPTNKGKYFTRTAGANPEVLTLRKNDYYPADNGLTYGTKTILVLYLDSSEGGFLGYTFLTGVDLHKSTDLEVKEVTLYDDVKVNGNLSLNLETNLPEVEEGDIMDAEGNPEYHYYHRGYCDGLLKVSAMLHDKDKNVDVNISNSDLVSWQLSEDTPDIEGETVLVEYSEKEGAAEGGQYTMKSAGTCNVTASLTSLASVTDTAEISVVSKNISGTVTGTVNMADWATISTATQATVGSSVEKLNIHPTEHTIVLNDTLTHRVPQVVTFFNAEGDVVGTGLLPEYILTINGEIIDPAETGIYDVQAK